MRCASGPAKLREPKQQRRRRLILQWQQALQAEACRVVPCAEMNPILIKPSSDTASQVVVLGRVWGQVTASDYHLRRVEDLAEVFH